MPLPEFKCPNCGDVVLRCDGKDGTAQGFCRRCRKIRTFPLPKSTEDVTRGRGDLTPSRALVDAFSVES